MSDRSRKFSVQATVVGKGDRVTRVQKDFNTEAARTAWLDKQEDRGTLVGDLAFADPDKK